MRNKENDHIGPKTRYGRYSFVPREDVAQKLLFSIIPKSNHLRGVFSVAVVFCWKL